LNFEIEDNQTTLFIVSGNSLEMNFDLLDIDNTIIFRGNKSDLNKQLRSISKGKMAPDFTLKDINGKMVSLSDFKGNYIYIDVWNSEFVDNYSIIFNPRFILLDTDLRFIYLSAPRPSGNCEEILRSLLNKY
jgi:hypothetical protein